MNSSEGILRTALAGMGLKIEDTKKYEAGNSGGADI
jgi:hypothetical protein